MGKLVLADADAFNFSVVVPSSSYPSRWLFFEPGEGGESGMAAYQEPVYGSRVKVTIKNVGSETFTCEYLGKEQIITAGKATTLPEIGFKDFRLKVAPKEGSKAEIELQLKFDKTYRTTSWKVVSEWSDGP